MSVDAITKPLRGGEATDAGDAGDASDELPPGARVDRYAIGERLGAGGMGVVYVARDDELARDVALKVLRIDDGDDLEEMRSRLQREAQAMARLSHPNVVPVFDIGASGGRLFIAMELVRGQSLRSWLATPRRWRDIVRVFVAAGRGLAAAHDAGLIHRDFKPDNVVGADRLPRVTDFGLARELERTWVDPPRDDEAATADTEKHTPPLERITVTGSIAGTPAYMPPEQLIGRGELGPAVDQFAFCVSLYEAVYGTRPFAPSGDDPQPVHLVAAIIAGRLAPPRDGRSAPRWLHTAIVRGLAADPDRRWPSMAALVTALDRGLGRTRRRVIAAAAVAVAVAGTLVAIRAGGDQTSSCPDPTARLAGVWDRGRRAAFAARFGGAHAWPSVAGAVDSYTSALSLARGEVCAARRAGRVAPRAAELETACLDVAQGHLAGALAAVERRPANDLDGVLHNLSLADKLALCIDPLLLEQMQPRPEQQAGVNALAPDLTRLTSLLGSADPAQARPFAEQVVERARALGHPPSLVQALVLLGELRADDPPTALALETEALAIADANGLWPSAFNAHRNLVDILAAQGRYADALPHAESMLAIARGHGDTSGAAGGASYRARMLVGLGRTDEALAAHELAIELASKATDAARVRAESDMANTLRDLGRHREALPHDRIAMQLMELEVGPDHPDFAGMMINVGMSEAMQDSVPDPAHLADARELITRGIAILERVDHPNVGLAYNGLGAIVKLSGDLAGAQAVFERALARPSKTGDIAAEINLRVNLADTEKQQGKADAALATIERGLAVVEQAFGPDAAQALDLLVIRAAVEIDLQADYAAGLATAQRADAIAARTKNEGYRGHLAQRMGLALFGLDRYREAAAQLESCQRRFHTDGDGHSEAVCATVLSQARWYGDRDGVGSAAAIDEALAAADAANEPADAPLRTTMVGWKVELARLRRRGR